MTLWYRESPDYCPTSEEFKREATYYGITWTQLIPQAIKTRNINRVR